LQGSKKTFNPEQIEAINHFEGPALVIANPGSGKTTVITERGANLIEKHGVDPLHILCITFTNKAAEEMRTRISERVGPTADQIHISTIHSLCVSILRKCNERLGINKNFTVFATDDQKSLMKKMVAAKGVERTEGQVKKMIEVVNTFREKLLDMEDCAVDLGMPLNDLDILANYLHQIEGYNAIDFSGLLYKTYELLRDHPKVAELLAGCFKFIQVDEGQDTNRVQMELVLRLGLHANVVVVADGNQSIYKFRGAEPNNLNRFCHHYENVTEYTLPRNYRSTKQILSAAEKLIRNNPNADKTRLIAERGQGDEIGVFSHRTPYDEASWAASHVNRLVSRYGMLHNDIAVLYRTNSQSQMLETEFKNRGIPYRIVGGFSFFDRREIKTAMSYFSLMANPFDIMAFVRAIGEPTRGVGSVSINHLEQYAQGKKIDLLEACSQADKISSLSKKCVSSLKRFAGAFEKAKGKSKMSKQAESLLDVSGYSDHIRELAASEKDTSTDRFQNLNEFLLSIQQYENRHNDASLSGFVQQIKLLTSQDKDKNSQDSVLLATQHAAKGLEYKAVFIVGAEYENNPHFLSLRDGDEDEERRLFFVAVTRAKDALFISWCRSRATRGKWGGGAKDRLPSPYILEMGLDEGNHY